MIFALLCFAVLFAYVFYYYAALFWKIRGVPYVTPTFPIVGNYLTLILGIESFNELTRRWYNSFPNQPYFGTHGFNRPFLFIRDLEIIKRITIKDFNHFQNRPFFADEKVDVLSSNNLFTLRSSAWKSARNKLTSVFTSGRMKLMFPLMKECGDELEKFLESCNGQTIDSREIAGRFTTDVISSCAFGIKSDTLTNPGNPIRKAAQRLFRPTLYGFINDFCFTFSHTLSRIFNFTFLDKEGVGFLRNIFARTIEQREKDGTKRNDMIDILIDIRNKSANDEYQMSGDRLVGQSIIFFSAGLEPSSAAISFTLYELAMNPDVQDRLRNEIHQVISKHQTLTYEAVQEMKYLDMVTNEGLRMYPFPAINLRECNENYQLKETNLVIEKNVSIGIPLYGLHYDPEYFPNPEQFDPERFNDENKTKIPPGAFIPFGDGPRVCIGERFGVLSTKVGIIYFIMKFRILKSPSTKKRIKFDPRSLVTYPKGGIPLIIERIDEF